MEEKPLVSISRKPPSAWEALLIRRMISPTSSPTRIAATDESTSTMEDVINSFFMRPLVFLNLTYRVPVPGSLPLSV